jgi:hypothetical protein
MDAAQFFETMDGFVQRSTEGVALNFIALRTKKQ